MKKIALALVFLGFSAMSFASIIQRDVMYDDGGSGAAHEWWVYLVAPPIALACYSLAGWLIHKAGRWGWVAAALIFAALGLVGKSFLLAFGLMFGVWIAWMVMAGNARKSQELDDRIALEKVYREKHGADWREHWDRDHGMLRIREKSKQGQEIQSNRAMLRITAEVVSCSVAFWSACWSEVIARMVNLPVPDAAFERRLSAICGH